MKKYILALAAVAAMLVSCSQDDNLEAVENGMENSTENSTPQPITTIYASSYDGGTRAAVNDDGTRILWQEGDKIGVMNSSMNTPYTLSNGVGTTSGEFSNAESGITSIDAVMYPYQENATYTNRKLSFEIPSVQEGVPGSFDKKAAIMYSLGPSANQQLSLAVNFLKITIPTRVRSVTISSPTTSLTGNMELEGGNVSAVTDKGCNYVRLVPADGNKYFISDDYYIAVKPGEIVTPTITFVKDDDLLGSIVLQENSKTSTNNIQFSDNKNVVPLRVDFNTGNVTQRLALQLWAGGPYFAQYNVGVTDGKEESYGGYYAWDGADTATKLWGPNWRMPTQAELQSLLDNCEVELKWDPSEGFIGRKFTGKGDYATISVLLPAAGSDNDFALGVNGYYWSSTPDGSEKAYCLGFNSSKQWVEPSWSAYFTSVRAVIAE